MAGKKVVISGANGRMGQEIKNLVGESSVLSLGAEVDRQGPQTEFEGLSGSMDVVIDFSSPELFRCALAWAVASGTPFVSGTTGLENSDFDQLKTAAQKIPVLWAANMSLGVNFLLSLLPQLKALDGYDIQVEELHHNRKLDAPSGTAKILQNELVSSSWPRIARSRGYSWRRNFWDPQSLGDGGRGVFGSGTHGPESQNFCAGRRKGGGVDLGSPAQTISNQRYVRAWGLK